jgi:integrase
METASRSNENDLIWEHLDSYFASLFLATNQGQRSTWKKWIAFLRVIEGTELGAARLLRATPTDAKGYMKARVEAKGRAPRNPGASDRISGRTCNKEWANLRTIYTRAFIENGILKTTNPFIAKCPVAKGGRQKAPTESADFDKVKAMIDWPSKFTPEGMRDRCWLAIGFGGALRISEATKLKICDIEEKWLKDRDGVPRKRYCLMLRETKNGSDAEQLLMPFVNPYIEAYRDHRLNVDWACETEPLLMDYDARGHVRRPASHQKLRRRFAMIRDDIGMKWITPHSMRATTISKMLFDGETHDSVKDFSRHSSVQQVERYDKRVKCLEKSPANRVDFE